MDAHALLKLAIATNLELQGHSLNDLEASLAELNTAQGVFKTAALPKEANPPGINPAATAVAHGLDSWIPSPSELADFLSGHVSRRIPEQMALGAVGGAGLQLADDSLKPMHQRIKNRKDQADLLEKTIAELKLREGLQ